MRRSPFYYDLFLTLCMLRLIDIKSFGSLKLFVGIDDVDSFFDRFRILATNICDLSFTKIDIEI